jgi:hypothetical protein
MACELLVPLQLFDSENYWKVELLHCKDFYSVAEVYQINCDFHIPVA